MKIENPKTGHSYDLILAFVIFLVCVLFSLMRSNFPDFTLVGM